MHGGSVFARCEGGEVLIGFLLPWAEGGVEPVAAPEREAVEA